MNASETAARPTVRAVYIGTMPGFAHVPARKLYNLLEALPPRFVMGSTVTEESVREAGFELDLTEDRSAALARPILRYYGGKYRLATWIISHFPAHTTYVEPFCGAASVLLRKEASRIEVINDLDKAVVNFFRILRERPEELQRQLRMTPFAREEYLACIPDSADPLECARRLFVCHWQSFGHSRSCRTGWKFFSRPKKVNGHTSEWTDWDKAIDSIPAAAQRLRPVLLECGDALAIICRYDTPETLFYVDPPYPANTRNRRWMTRGYNHDLTNCEHVHLGNVLRGIKGMAIVSSYPNPIYDDLFDGWRREEKTAQTMNKTISREVLYISPNAQARLKASSAS